MYNNCMIHFIALFYRYKWKIPFSYTTSDNNNFNTPVAQIFGEDSGKNVSCFNCAANVYIIVYNPTIFIILILTTNNNY